MSDGLNQVHLIGNLGQDPEMRYTANGSAVTTFRMAVSRSWTTERGKQEDTQWFTVVTWNKLAEVVGQYAVKGRRVYAGGRLATRSWDGPDGQKRYATEIVADKVLFLDRSGGEEGGAHYPQGGDIDPDDLPFGFDE